MSLNVLPAEQGATQTVATYSRRISVPLRALVNRDSRKRTHRTLTVGPDCQWFRCDDGPCVSLRRRRPLRLILAALVSSAIDSPGRGSSRKALIAAGWPGERMRVDSAANRAYVALFSLRDLGLRHVILTRADGYLIDPRIPIEVDE